MGDREVGDDVSAIVRGVIDAEVVSVTSAGGLAVTDLDAERAVLAAILLDGDGAADVWRTVSSLLTARSFADPRHALVFDCVAAIVARGQHVDVVTLGGELTARRRLHTVGGAQWLGELTDGLPTLAHCETHARLVLAASVRRELGRRAREAQPDRAELPQPDRAP